MNIKKIVFWTLLLVVWGFNLDALAHSTLSSSSPDNGAVLTEVPDKLELNFKSEVKLIKVTLIHNQENEVPVLLESNKGFASSFSVELPVLNSGKYQVSWMVMGKDTHKITGDFTFELKKK